MTDAAGWSCAAGTDGRLPPQRALQLRVNIDKVLDCRYYQALGHWWSGDLERYGAPRSVLLSLNYKMQASLQQGAPRAAALLHCRRSHLSLLP